MPIKVEDYSWTQSGSLVNIVVPLKGVAGNKVDIFNTDEYIKVSYPPYIFEVFLNASVNDSHSKATISHGKVSFVLEKQMQDVPWPQLQHASFKDKEFTKQKRDEAVLYSQQKAKEELERRARESDQQKKFAVRQQMRIEEEERQRIQGIKDAENTQASTDIENWKKEKDRDIQNISHDSNASKNTEKGKKTEDAVINSPKDEQSSQKEMTPGNKNIFKDDDIPPPRSASTIQLSFTPRAFVTPSRESKAPEEEAWLEKVAEMRKLKVDVQSKENFEEMNPVWLKDKGTDFYKKGNYIAAINAFTAAIMLNGTDPSLYNNRAACHLHMKQFSECIQDTTMALNLLDPPVAANAKSRCIALVRRGTAHFQVEDFVEALQDYEAALKIDPSNENLKADAERIRDIIQGT